MVQQYGFQVQLVEATSKVPFIEHTKANDDGSAAGGAGKTYAEVEPDTEYYLSIQKTKVHAGYDRIIIKYLVDDQDLGYHTHYGGNHIDTEPAFRGLWSRVDGVSGHTALKFTKPRFTDNEGGPPATGGGSRRPLLMGRVQIEIYEGIFNGYANKTKNYSARDIDVDFAAAPIDMNANGGAAKKKSLRSTAGTAVINEKNAVVDTAKEVATYKCGNLLDVITLNYCAALGLIIAGILPKPPAWALHQMKHPAKKNTNLPDGVVVKKRAKAEGAPAGSNAAAVDVIDMCGVHSDGDDSGEED